MRVAEDERPPGADVVDVLVAIGVKEVRAESANDPGRLAADGAKRAHGGIHAAGNHLFGALLQLARELSLAGQERNLPRRRAATRSGCGDQAAKAILPWRNCTLRRRKAAASSAAVNPK